jgi:hypothetical protein
MLNDTDDYTKEELQSFRSLGYNTKKQLSNYLNRIQKDVVEIP